MAKNHKVVFKAYSPGQAQLLPPSLDELIADNHPVRIVNQVIDSVDLQLLEKSYKGGGTSCFHPRMLLKVLIYGYVTNIYSSRKLEAAVKENIHFMWLAGMSRPDHHTINRFRGERLQHTLKDIFTRVVELLVQEGVLSIRDIYTDGTKIEAVANRYTFVWAKAIKNHQEKIKVQLEALWQYARQLTKAEEALPPDLPDFTLISKEKVQQAIDQIGQALKDKAEVSKGARAKAELR